MISLGAVKVGTNESYFAQFEPISKDWIPSALAISEIDRKTHLSYPRPQLGMEGLLEFIETTNKSGRPVMWSDNIAYDWQFVNYYFHKYFGSNPFGFSGRRIGDLYCGHTKDLFAKWKHLRITKHTHNPVDDAMGNAEALINIFTQMGIKCVS